MVGEHPALPDLCGRISANGWNSLAEEMADSNLYLLGHGNFDLLRSPVASTGFHHHLWLVFWLLPLLPY